VNPKECLIRDHGSSSFSNLLLVGSIAREIVPQDDNDELKGLMGGRSGAMDFCEIRHPAQHIMKQRNRGIVSSIRR